jgi:cobaltochelatase CobN
MKDSENASDALIRLERLLTNSYRRRLDPARRDRLVNTIREEAQSQALNRILASVKMPARFEAMTRIDRFVCISKSQYGDGLHIFWRAQARMTARSLLNGRRNPGPSIPYRGRTDVPPTGETSIPRRSARYRPAPPIPKWSKTG